MYKELVGKTALVTGGGHNLGRTICQELLNSGVNVVVSDIRADLAEETAVLIARDRGADGAKTSAMQLDIRDAASVGAVFGRIEGEFGGVDILVNNAAVTQAGRPLLPDIPDDLFHRIIMTNVVGTWHCMREAIPQMAERGEGYIVNISSVHGLISDIGMAAYTASKHAIIGLTKGAALEWGPKGVRINAVCPSRLDGAMLGKSRSTDDPVAKLEGDRRMNPASGRAGKPEEVAATVVFLCSRGAASIHGAALPVDGGYTAH
jgi:NAD(P)-dependent dehydrogenase (short-subunit alcohol dehydrogenase family)